MKKIAGHEQPRHPAQIRGNLLDSLPVPHVVLRDRPSVPENRDGFGLDRRLQKAFELRANGFPDAFVGPIEDLRF